MKKLSVITICYNEPNLEKTCESIVNQTWQDFEWVVIDGGSNKETQEIWDKYKYRIDKFVSEPDNGIYNACNKGIKLATGEYLIFMNAGDAFYTKDILSLFHCFSETNEADVYYGEVEQVYKKPDKLGDHVTNSPIKLPDDFFIKSNIPTQGMFIKSSLFDTFGLYNEELKIVSDFEKNIQIFKAGAKFVYIPLIVSEFDMGGISGNTKSRRICKLEVSEVRHKYFDKKIIDEVCNSTKITYSNFERIFSVKNTHDYQYKIMTILGVRIKIKRRKV